MSQIDLLPPSDTLNWTPVIHAFEKGISPIAVARKRLHELDVSLFS
jgi:hypothetical protein